jgi:2-polyprenyl-3-methyl-5-hydroxy-6-metoxy-1,4-benzoquinol methylase
LILSIDINTCYLCGSEGQILYERLSDRFFGVQGSWSVYRCCNSHCQLSWLTPRPLDSELSKLYLNYLTHDLTVARDGFTRREKLIDTVFFLKHGLKTAQYQGVERILSFLLLHFGPYREMVDGLTFWLDTAKSKRVLDVGCGSGDFLEKMQYLGWDAVGLETDPVLMKIAREKGIEVLEGDLLAMDLPDGSFDVITMSHVIEHLPDPLEYLRKCRELLVKQGQLVLLTPNVSSFSHRKYKEFWVDLDPPRHLYHFSPSSLSQMVETAGFKIDTARTTARMASPRWRASALLKKSGVLSGYNLPKDRSITKAFGILFQFVEHFASKYCDVGEEIVLKAIRE